MDLWEKVFSLGRFNQLGMVSKLVSIINYEFKVDRGVLLQQTVNEFQHFHKEDQ